MHQSDQINELVTALAKAQGEISPAIKDSTNPFFKSRYADLKNIWDACKSALTKNGLAVLQTTDYIDNQIFLITTLAHGSGQWMKSIMPINPTKNDSQGIGSAITYMRRYSLAAIVGVTTDEDDDGNMAVCANNNHAKAQSSTFITKRQADELDYMLQGCDEIYQTQFWGFLKKEAPEVQTFSQLPLQMYSRIKGALEKKFNESSKELVNA